MFQPVIKTNLNNNEKLDKVKRNNLVAKWYIPLCDKQYEIEFEHGTATGKRVIFINGKEILRRDWMFKLVGDETFTIGPQDEPHQCILQVEPRPNFLYEYTLVIDGLEFKNFIEKQKNIICIWKVPIADIDNKHIRVGLNKITQDLWVDGIRIDDTETDFINNGTLTKLQVNGSDAIILGTPQQNNKKIIIKYDLYVNCVKIEEEEIF